MDISALLEQMSTEHASDIFLSHETEPGKSWNVILRLYGPLEPWFDRTWRPGDIEPLE